MDAGVSQSGFQMEERAFPGTLDALEPVRAYVASAAEAAGLDRGAVYSLCLAVDEIATNVVLHGYEEAGISGELRVGASLEPRGLVIRLQDEGKSYDPSLHHVPSAEDLSLPLEERRPGGLGIFLARDAVDELQYAITDRGNVHTFVMRVPGSAPAK